VRVRVNGQERDVDPETTVLDVLALLEIAGDARGVAVAVERDVVPRGQWPSRVLLEGEQVEIVTAMQGG
jgi:sulfur carrier protein